MCAQLALKHKQSVTLGTGSGIWNRIHILDVSNLYFLLISKILDNTPPLTSGKTGYYFAENGFQSWRDIAERIGKIGKELGVFETAEVGEVNLQEGADEV